MLNRKFIGGFLVGLAATWMVAFVQATVLMIREYRADGAKTDSGWADWAAQQSAARSMRINRRVRRALGQNSDLTPDDVLPHYRGFGKSGRFE